MTDEAYPYWDSFPSVHGQFRRTHVKPRREGSLDSDCVTVPITIRKTEGASVSADGDAGIHTWMKLDT